MDAIAASSIDSMREAGFNFYEYWPNDTWERGSFDNRAAMLRAADRKGFLVAAGLPGMAWLHRRFHYLALYLGRGQAPTV
jgi:hypothetical protein